MQNLKVLGIVQVRMGSKRLPGKVQKEILGKPMLWYLLKRLWYSNEIDQNILATSLSIKDDVLNTFAKNNNIHCYRGSEDDVLCRFYEASTKFNGEVIVRITGDCPLVDPLIVDELIQKHITSCADYTSNTLKRTFPRGFDVEIFNYDVLKEAHYNALKSYEKEHVTPYIYNNPKKFKLKNVEAPRRYNKPHLRLTVDTKEDFELIKRVFEALYVENRIFHIENVFDFLNRNPELTQINSKIKQKEITKNIKCINKKHLSAL